MPFSLLTSQELSTYFKDNIPPIYFGLATVLLKMVLKDKLRHSPDLKLLEIGVGAYAVLSGCISRWKTQTIDAIDIELTCVKSAKKHIDLNQVDVRVFQSNLFSNVPSCKYDLIFWNPPYDQDPDTYLPGLFREAPDFMSEKSQLIIVYNSKALLQDTVLNILSNYEKLQVVEIKKWWWNIQEVVILNKKAY